MKYLKNVSVGGKISHAYIFEGIEGVGKHRVAQYFAQLLFCLNKEEAVCGVCKACLKMDHDNHPDLMYIEPDGTTIKNEQIEKFQEFANIKPYESQYKIVIIDQADKMNASSQNRILKTLEEPPEHVLMILVTANKNKLLPTVTSRCQHLVFNGVERQIISEYLMESHNLTAEKADLTARLSIGSIGKAIESIENEVVVEWRNKSIELFSNLCNNERGKVLAVQRHLSKNREFVMNLLDNMILLYRDLLITKKSKMKDLVTFINEYDNIKRYTRKMSIKQIIDCIETIELTKKKLNQHANFDLSLEYMLIKLLEV